MIRPVRRAFLCGALAQAILVHVARGSDADENDSASGGSSFGGSPSSGGSSDGGSLLGDACNLGVGLDDASDASGDSQESSISHGSGSGDGSLLGDAFNFGVGLDDASDASGDSQESRISHGSGNSVSSSEMDSGSDSPEAPGARPLRRKNAPPKKTRAKKPAGKKAAKKATKPRLGVYAAVAAAAISVCGGVVFLVWWGRGESALRGSEEVTAGASETPGADGSDMQSQVSADSTAATPFVTILAGGSCCCVLLMLLVVTGVLALSAPAEPASQTLDVAADTAGAGPWPGAHPATGAPLQGYTSCAVAAPSEEHAPQKRDTHGRESVATDCTEMPA